MISSSMNHCFLIFDEINSLLHYSFNSRIHARCTSAVQQPQYLARLREVWIWKYGRGVNQQSKNINKSDNNINMSVLYRLPTDLSQFVLHAWLDLVDFAFLDGAFCSTTERQFIVELITDQHFPHVLNPDIHKGNYHCINWVNTKIFELIISNFVIKMKRMTLNLFQVFWEWINHT